MRRHRRKMRALRGRYGWSRVPGTRVEFGKERTPAQCRARAKWELATAAEVEKLPHGHIMAAAHRKTAEDYEWLARKRERDPVGRRGKSRS